MKLKDIERILLNYGYILIRSTSHRIYSNGKRHVAIPMHRDINKFLAQRIIKEISK